MTWTKLSLNPNKLAFAISFALLGFTPVQAQPRLPLILVQRLPLNSKGDSNSSKPTQDQGAARGTVPAGTYAGGGDITRDLTFEQPPPDQGAPRGTKPGGERGCPSVAQKPLTALVPVTKEADGTQLRWGLTTKELPTFWFYVPYQLKSIRSAKFSLRNQAKQTVYETPVILTGAPGVISISLPSTAPPLEINKWYQSYLFIDISCEPNAPLEKDSAQGWVKREALAPALKSELDNATTPQQRAMLYAKHGVWYEVVMTLAELSRTDPKDAEWTKLLQSVGLDAIASEPIVNCCKPEN
jgi:hypothetical protein